MALRRTLSLRSLFSARCYQPSCSSIILRDSDYEEKPNYGSLLHQRSFSSSILSHHLGRSSHLSLCTPFGVPIYRSMSTSHVPGSDDYFDVDHVTRTAIDSVLEDVASQTTTVINVSDATIESPVHLDVFQQIIHNVHSFTGLNWWTSIVLTTLLIRRVTIPLMVYNEKWWSRQLMLGKHHVESVEIIQSQGWDSAALARHQRTFHKLVKEYDGQDRIDLNLSYLWKVRNFLYVLQHWGFLFIGFSIKKMAEKVASFQTGGTLWFTDLTTPDALYIFPVLTGVILWITIEYDAIVGFEGLKISKNVTQALLIFGFLDGIFLSKAVHCYLMSSMLFSIAFMHVIRLPEVKKQLGIPEVPEDLATKLCKKISEMDLEDLKEKTKTH